MTETKGYKGLGMEGFVAKWYAASTQRSRDDFRALARRVAGSLPPGSAVLEIAPGPGYFAIELARQGDYRVTGLDISRTFVDLARERAAEEKARVDFQLGNASEMPFEDESFDFTLCRAAFKNFSEPVRALQEMHRVLKPGGRAVIIDLKRDASKEAVDRMVEAMSLSRVSRWTTKVTFHMMLLKRAYTRTQFEEMIARAKFSRTEITESDTGLEITMTR